jgi:hypothetical protein
MAIRADGDDMAIRRARIARWAARGRQAGYGLLGMAVVVFAVGAAAGFTPGLVSAVVAAMALGSLLLAPAIIVGYGVKAAAREDP